MPGAVSGKVTVTFQFVSPSATVWQHCHVQTELTSDVAARMSMVVLAETMLVGQATASVAVPSAWTSMAAKRS